MIDYINRMSKQPAYDMFFSCCSCDNWANAMVKARPYTDISQVYKAAEQLWNDASEKDILAAFSAHPKIGDLHALRNKYARTEQGQIREANDEVLEALHRLNKEYEIKFGFIFIVCATGKSAEEMLAVLQSRIVNSRVQELATGAAEQQKITAIRLQKILGES